MSKTITAAPSHDVMPYPYLAQDYANLSSFVSECADCTLARTNLAMRLMLASSPFR